MNDLGACLGVHEARCMIIGGQISILCNVGCRNLA